MSIVGAGVSYVTHTASAVGRPIVATAAAITDFLRRALWRRRRSRSDYSGDSQSSLLFPTNKIVRVQADGQVDTGVDAHADVPALEAEAHACLSAGEALAGPVLDMLSGHSDALPPAAASAPPADLHLLLDDLTAAEMMAEVLDLDAEAIEAGLHRMGLRARMLEPSSKKFGRLVTLSFRNCDVERLPEYIWTGAGSVAVLVAYGNRLTRADERLANFSCLRVLDLSDNQLTDLPESLQRLQALHALDLSGNPIERVPTVLAELPALRVLCLCRCRLHTLTGLQHSALTELHAADNQLPAVPYAALPSTLRMLNVAHNPLEVPLPDPLPALPRLHTLLADGCALAAGDWAQGRDGFRLHC